MTHQVLVLMPLLHESNYVEEAIASVKRQVGVQIIIAAQDNMSDDNTYLKFKELTSGDERFHISRTRERLSQSDNWNSLADRALNEFPSDFVIWMGGDDIWVEQDFLQNLVEGVDGNSIAACPSFQHSIVSEPEAVTLRYSVELDKEDPNSRFRELLANWKTVNAIHALYRIEPFREILNSNMGRPFNYLGFDWWWVLKAIQLGPISDVSASTMDKRIKKIIKISPGKALRRFFTGILTDLRTFYSRTGMTSEIPLSWKLMIRCYFTYRIFHKLISLPIKSWGYFISKL